MKVSVVTINLNNREGLARTLASLARQTHKDFELIVVDGGSSDGSVELCRSFGSLVGKHIVEPDDGIYDAWNKGIRASTGNLIGLLNSGDEYHPAAIAQVLESAPAGRYDDVVLCGTTFLVREGRILRSFGNRLRRRLCFGIGVSHPAMFVGRNVYAKVGHYEPISIASDSDFILRCIRAGVDFVPAPYRVFMAADGVSQRQAAQAFSQYTNSLVRLGFCRPARARLIATSYRAYRGLVRAGIVAAARSFAANMRHFAIRLMNLAHRVAVPLVLRRVLWRLYGFQVHRKAFVSPFVTFYGRRRFRIDEGSVVNRGVTIDNRDSVVVGKGCSISQGATILTAGHDIDSPYFEYVTKPVVIRDHVAILSGAWVMPGTVLEQGVVVLPGAVVSGATVENGVYGGVPARLMRKRVSEPVHKFEYPRPFAL